MLVYKLIFLVVLLRNDKMPVKVGKRIKVCLAAYNNSNDNNDRVEGANKYYVALFA
jgi:hypothetical protein